MSKAKKVRQVEQLVSAYFTCALSMETGENERTKAWLVDFIGWRKQLEKMLGKMLNTDKFKMLPAIEEYCRGKDVGPVQVFELIEQAAELVDNTRNLPDVYRRLQEMEEQVTPAKSLSLRASR